jgi:hypothetical protein
MDEPTRIDPAAAHVVASWHGLAEAEKRRLRHDVALDRTISTVAMEGESVSQVWIDQARLQRVQRSDQADDSHVSEL